MLLEHYSGFAEGPVPEEFDSFQMTDWIGLHGNKLNGPLWNTSFHCFMHSLDISNNQFSGELHPDFMMRNQNHAEIINFAHNQFSGPLPARLNDLKYLVALLMNDNKFSGAIPDLSKAMNLRHLDLARNQLTGAVGPWVKELKNLARLDLSGNEGLTGTLPELPQSISNFSAGGTQFSGKIPDSYAKLPFLRHFDCTGCKLECPPDFFNHVYFSTHCRQPRKWDA